MLTPSGLTPAQKRLWESLAVEPESWAECDKSEWKTALALLRKGLISINVGKETFHGLPTTPSGTLMGPAPRSFDAKIRMAWNDAIQKLVELGSPQMVAVENDAVEGTPAPEADEEPEVTDPKELLRREFAAVQERIRDAATDQWDWRGRSADQKIDSLASAVVDLAKLCEKVLLGE